MKDRLANLHVVFLRSLLIKSDTIISTESPNEKLITWNNNHLGGIYMIRNIASNLPDKAVKNIIINIKVGGYNGNTLPNRRPMK